MKTIQLYFNNDSTVSVKECLRLSRYDMITVAEETGKHYYIEGNNEGFQKGYSFGVIYTLLFILVGWFGIRILGRLRKHKQLNN